MPNPKPLPSIERLQELLSFDYSGNLYWAQDRGVFVKAGDKAGSDLLTGYRSVVIDGQRCLVHRVIWALQNKQDPGLFQIDHINGDSRDNRPCNLRLATRAQNAINKKQVKKRSKTGHAGVYYYKQWGRRPYRANVGHRILGYFLTLEEAVKARSDYLLEHAGEFNPEICRDK